MIDEDYDDLVEEEVCALEATLMEDVQVLRADNGSVQGVEVCVVPATAQNVSEQHVRCTLVAAFPPSYPAVHPIVTIRNPRGIDDSVLKKIEQEIAARCVECEGSPVIYELIEMVRENLTANNAPSCPCTICLYHFSETDHFTKTQCYHYFHKHCLGRYVSSCEVAHEAALAEQQLPWQRKQDALLLLCPVCREPITVKESTASLLCGPGPALEAAEQQWRPDAPDVQALRRNMTKLFKRQQQRGGIIDLEHEKNKFLVSQAVEPRIEDQPVGSATDSLSPDEGDHTRADDSRADDSRADDSRADDSRADDSRSDDSRVNDYHLDNLNMGDNEPESPLSDNAVCSSDGGGTGAEDAPLPDDKKEQRPLSPQPPDTPSAGMGGEQEDCPPLPPADHSIKSDRRVADSDAADRRRGRGRAWGGRGGGGSFRGSAFPQGRGGGYGDREGRGGSNYNNGVGGGRGGRNDAVQQRVGFRGRGRGRSQWGAREGYNQHEADESYNSRYEREGDDYYHEYNNAQHQRGVGNNLPKVPPSRQYYNGNSQQQQPPTSRYGPPRMQHQYHSNGSYKQYSNNQYKSRGDQHAHAGRYMSNEARDKLAANDRTTAATYES